MPVLTEQQDRSPRVIMPTQMITVHPEMAAAVWEGLGDEYKYADVEMGQFSDRTPHVRIEETLPGVSQAVILGCISGETAEESLQTIVKVGHALRHKYPKDARSPRANLLHLVLSDYEGRGDKPSLDGNGQYIDAAELLFASYAAEQLTAVGKVDRVTILHPHSIEGVTEFGVPVLPLSYARDTMRQVQKSRMIAPNEKVGIVIPDKGGIRLAMELSDITGFPIVARLDKVRMNGKPIVKDAWVCDDCSDMTLLLADDMLGSGGTIQEDGLEIHKRLQPKRFLAMVGHIKDVNSSPKKIAGMLNTYMANGRPFLSGFIATNSTPYSDRFRGMPGVLITDVAPLMTLAMRAALNPTEENQRALEPHVLSMGSHDEALALLHQRNPKLTPDYQSSTSPNGTVRSETVYVS